MVPGVFYANPQRRLHRSQEKPEMGARRGMGTILPSAHVHPTADHGRQGMQFFNFIFLARSWASDRVQLASDLSALGRQAEQQDKPLTLIIYPEGTLVSKDTRPISKRYADKIGMVGGPTKPLRPCTDKPQVGFLKYITSSIHGTALQPTLTLTSHTLLAPDRCHHVVPR